MMKCDICCEETENVQTFTTREGDSLRLCRKDYDILVGNDRVTGKIVPKKCKACKSVIGYDWIPYKAPGRKKDGARGNEKLDTFFDMRTPLDRLIEKKVKRIKKVEDAARPLEQEPRNLCAEEAKVEPASSTISVANIPIAGSTLTDDKVETHETD
jgi:hypothetical protein